MTYCRTKKRVGKTEITERPSVCRVLAQIKFVIQIIIAVEKINIFTNLAKYIFNYSKIRFCDKFKL